MIMFPDTAPSPEQPSHCDPPCRLNFTIRLSCASNTAIYTTLGGLHFKETSVWGFNGKVQWHQKSAVDKDEDQQ